MLISLINSGWLECLDNLKFCVNFHVEKYTVSQNKSYV